MVDVEFEPQFKKQVQKIKDSLLKQRLKKQIIKIKENPEVGKPMRHARRGTREVYLPPFRLSYLYLETRILVILLEIYHKAEQ